MSRTGEEAREQGGGTPEPDGTADAGPAGAGAGTEGSGSADAGTAGAGWRRLLEVSRPRATGAQLLAGLLCLVLGAALVVQVRQRDEADLTSLRQADLVALLDDTTARADRLAREAEELERTRDELLSSSDAEAAALEATRERVEVLGVLAGTVPATGPGIRLVLSGGGVDADLLLAAVQEMRDAGAEAIQVGDTRQAVRVVASTAFTAATSGPEGSVAVDGTVLEPPFTFLAIGDATTLASAMEFPGGVVSTAEGAGGTAAVTPLEEVVVDALRPLETPTYARPADPPAGDPGG